MEMLTMNTFSTSPTIAQAKKTPGEAAVQPAGRKSSPAECETCKNRKYKDGSDEMVSQFLVYCTVMPKNPHSFRYIFARPLLLDPVGKDFLRYNI